MMADSNNALDSWAPRSQTSLAQVRSRAIFVRRFRLGLMVIATITIGIFLGYVFSGLFSNGSDTDAIRMETETVTMLNPRIRGYNDDGTLKYLIIAESAARRRENSDLIDLNAPKLTRDDSSEITAVRGTWDRTTEILELQEEVVITDWAGYVLYSSQAVISIPEGIVRGNAQLQGTGPLGDLRADGYELYDNGERIRLTGNVRTVIYPDTNEETGEP